MILLHMIKVYWKALLASVKTFGFFSKDGLLGLFMPVWLLFTHFTLWLDHIFFPAWKKVEIKNPIFIIGHPRSGTTFLHRLILKTDEYVSFKTWELSFPALTARKLVKGLIDKRVAAGKHVLFPPETGHHTQLDMVEEEEQLFMHLIDTQFASIVFPLGFYEGDFDELLYNDKQAHRKTSIRYFKNCLKRQIYSSGKEQIFARCNFSAMRIKTLAAEFPDAKFIYIYRNPLESISSHLSLNNNVFDYKWGLDKIGEKAMNRYFDRRYRYNVAYYKYIEKVKSESEMLRGMIHEVHYKDFLENFENVIVDLKKFIDIPISDELNRVFEEQAIKQKSYKRKHKNLDLEKINLTEERIREDLAFMFDKIEAAGGA